MRAPRAVLTIQDKRARKFIKRRVGTMRRAKVYVQHGEQRILTDSKMESLTNVIAEQRRAGH